MSRLSRVGSIFNGVNVEAKRQAVRLGHDVVGLVHVLLAMITYDVTLDAARIEVPTHHSHRNRGGAILRAHGIDAHQLWELATSRGGPPEPSAEILTEQLKDLRPGDPFTGTDVVTAMTRAAEISLSHRHPDTGTSHLLLAMVQDDAGEGAAVLRDLHADPEAVRVRLAQELGAAPGAW